MSIARLLGALGHLGLDPEPRSVAEALWLAPHLSGSDPAHGTARPTPGRAVVTDRCDAPTSPPAAVAAGGFPEDPAAVAGPPPTAPDVDELALYVSESGPGADRSRMMSIRAPAAVALPGKLAIGRALRPLYRTVPDAHRQVLDEERTVAAIAQTGVWVPFWRPAGRRWLGLRLVIDTHTSMAVWSPLVEELTELVERLGVFRDVRTGWLREIAGRGLVVTTGPGGTGQPVRSAPAMDGAHLILVVSDCVASYWRSGPAYRLLQRWGRRAGVAVLQPLPQRLWARTGLVPVRGRLSVRGSRSVRGSGGVRNADLRFTPRQWRPDDGLGAAVPIPVLQIEPEWLRGWARLTGGMGSCDAVVTLAPRPAAGSAARRGSDTGAVDPADRVRSFRASASPQAFRLATYLSAMPTTLPVMRLVQQTVTPASRPCHLAEVLLGGLLVRVPSDDDELRFRFVPGVREQLSRLLLVSDLQRIRYQISGFLADQLGISLREFVAAVAVPAGFGDTALVDIADRPFAALPAPVVARLGGRFRDLVEPVGDDHGAPVNGFRPPCDDNVEERLGRARRLVDQARRSEEPDERRRSLDQAIRLYRELFRPGQPSGPLVLGLAGALRARFDHGGDPADLTEALHLAQAGLDAVGAGDRDAARRERAELIAELAAIRLALFRRDGLMVDLTEGIRLARVALAACAPDDPALTDRRIGLAEALLARFAVLRTPADIDEALETYTSALTSAAETDQPGLMTRIGGILRSRYDVSGDPADLDRAVAGVRRALRTESASALTALGELLRRRYELAGSEPDLREAGSLFQRAFRVARDDDRVAAVRGMSRTEAALFRITNDPVHLDAAIEYGRSVVAAAASDDHRATAELDALGELLQVRANRSRHPSDIDAAVRALRQLLAAVPAYHPRRPDYLYRLGAALELRYHESGEISDLWEASDSYQMAVTFTPSTWPARVTYLTASAGALRLRATRTGARTDLDAARVALTTAVESTPVHDPLLPDRMWWLAETLEGLGRHDEAVGRLRAAIDAYARVRGPDDERTLRTRLAFGRSLVRAGRATEAYHELTAVIDVLSQRHGPEYPQVLAARHDGAVALRRLGDLVGAERELRAVWEIRRRVLGEDDPLTRATRQELDQWT